VKRTAKIESPLAAGISKHLRTDGRNSESGKILSEQKERALRPVLEAAAGRTTITNEQALAAVRAIITPLKNEIALRAGVGEGDIAEQQQAIAKRLAEALTQKANEKSVWKRVRSDGRSAAVATKGHIEQVAAVLTKLIEPSVEAETRAIQEQQKEKHRKKEQARLLKQLIGNNEAVDLRHGATVGAGDTLLMPDPKPTVNNCDALVYRVEISEQKAAELIAALQTTDRKHGTEQSVLLPVTAWESITQNGVYSQVHMPEGRLKITARPGGAIECKSPYGEILPVKVVKKSAVTSEK